MFVSTNLSIKSLALRIVPPVGIFLPNIYPQGGKIVRAKHVIDKFVLPNIFISTKCRKAYRFRHNLSRLKFGVRVLACASMTARFGDPIFWRRN
jgi:hypothetical protein